MTCEFAGGCWERLEEYWEVEGRMLCERHAGVVAQGVGAGGSGDEEDGGGDEERWSRKGAKAMKRVTRFIDLTGGGVGGLTTPVAPASAGLR